MTSLADLQEEYGFLDPDDRYRLLIDLGRDLEAMPEPLKTDATLVRGCSASVWVGVPMRPASWCSGFGAAPRLARR